ncbi:unnamed protein product [Orchesella dallaii]|uniref:Peptidase S1 domain-containing protein n=1 Tax=Orchesella dallaii TaxID=48710 RepID=A0ABP1REK7_9HEXA
MKLLLVVGLVILLSMTCCKPYRFKSRLQSHFQHQYYPRYRRPITHTTYFPPDFVNFKMTHPDSELTGRVIGGRNARREIKYQLRLTVTKANGNKNFCGAALVSMKGVQFGITAAHCVDTVSPSYARIIAGDYSLYYYANEQYRTPSKLVMHELYNRDSLANDIALLFYTTPFKTNSYVGTIRLPEYLWDIPAYVQISGWGSTAVGTNPIYPDILQVAELYSLRPNCDMFRGWGVTWKQICLLQSGVGSCIGDSGGPVVARNTTNDIKYLVGISSYGSGDCSSSTPSVLTRVSAYIDWIESQVANYQKKLG